MGKLRLGVIIVPALYILDASCFFDFVPPTAAECSLKQCGLRACNGSTGYFDTFCSDLCKNGNCSSTTSTCEVITNRTVTCNPNADEPLVIHCECRDCGSGDGWQLERSASTYAHFFKDICRFCKSETGENEPIITDGLVCSIVPLTSAIKCECPKTLDDY